MKTETVSLPGKPRAALKALITFWIARGLLIGALLGVSAQACQAQTETMQVRVRLSARDTATPDGARRLLHRIDLAALEACGASRDSLLQVRAAVMASDCWRQGVAEAVRSVGSPLLTAIAEAQPMTRLTAAPAQAAPGRGDETR
jgi:UrcA family protein